MSNDLKQLIGLLEKYCGDIELVSYGLAPNPNGFCFEVHNANNITESHMINICYLLDTLSSKDTELLREAYL